MFLRELICFDDDNNIFIFFLAISTCESFINVNIFLLILFIDFLISFISNKSKYLYILSKVIFLRSKPYWLRITLYSYDVITIVAKGTTEIYNLEYIDRGYENIEQKFRNLGAKIKRVEED